MKGFIAALCIFLLWTSACIYYVSTRELEADPAAANSVNLDNDSMLNTQEKGTTETILQDKIDEDLAFSNEIDTLNQDELINSSSETSTLNRSESKLLADEIMKSIAISDTIDFTKDEPELKFENSFDATPNNSLSSNDFYPYYKNTDLIIDQELVQFARELRTLIKEDPTKKITIIGHTDNVGNGRDNFSTALKKARQVKWYLTTLRGIPRKNLKAISRGEEEPIATNNTRQGRNKNNRVQIIVE